MKNLFDSFATRVSDATGAPLASFLAIGMVFLWVITGPLFGFSETWQLFINTSTTIITFLMVFLIQHSENKNSKALQIKIDDLIAAIEPAHNELIGLEQRTDEEIKDAGQNP